MAIPKKTLEDLEFDIVVDNILSYCVTTHGKEKLKSLFPSSNFDQINFSLNLVSEYLSSLENDNNFPNHFFESISKEIKIIQIDNSQLDIDSFRKCFRETCRKNGGSWRKVTSRSKCGRNSRIQ